MYPELSKQQNVCLEKAKQRGYLICTSGGNGMLLYVWIEWCRAQNQVCLYALLDDERSDIVLNTTTTENERVKGSPSALQNTCNKYIRTANQARVHDTDGCRISGVRIHLVSKACSDILSVARSYWPEVS